MRFSSHTNRKIARIVDALLSTNWSEGLMGQMAHHLLMPDERAAAGDLAGELLAAQPVEHVGAYGRVGLGAPAYYTVGSPWFVGQGSRVRGHDDAIRTVSGSPNAIHPHNWPVTTCNIAHPCWGCYRH